MIIRVSYVCTWQILSTPAGLLVQGAQSDWAGTIVLSLVTLLMHP